MDGVDISEFVSVEDNLHSWGFSLIEFLALASIALVIVCVVSNHCKKRTIRSLFTDESNKTGNLFVLGLFFIFYFTLVLPTLLVGNPKSIEGIESVEAREAIGSYYGVEYPLGVGVPYVNGQIEHVSLRVSGTKEFYRDVIITRSEDNIVQVLIPNGDSPVPLVPLPTPKN